MKSKKITTVLATLLFSCGLVGCGTTTEKLPEVVSNFKISNETGEFSFTGVSEAKTYYVRVFNHVETKTVTNEDGTTKEVELTLDEKMPVAARRIRFKSDTTEYTGEVDYTDLVPGNNYDAYVYTYIKNDAGDLISDHTAASAFIYKSTYSTPKINSSTLLAAKTDTGVSITIENGFFADGYISKGANYMFNLYKEGADTLTTTVLANQIETKEVESKDSSGNVTKSTESTATFSFTFDGELNDYSIAAKVLSTDDTAYYDSAESEKVALSTLLPVETPEGGDQGGQTSENP